MTNTSRIEEIAKFLRINLCTDKTCNKCYYNGFGSNDDRFCPEYWHAKRLVDSGFIANVEENK